MNKLIREAYTKIYEGNSLAAGDEVEISSTYDFPYKNKDLLLYYQEPDYDNPDLAIINIGRKDEYNKFKKVATIKVPFKFVGRKVYPTGPGANLGQNHPDPNIWNTYVNMPTYWEKR